MLLERKECFGVTILLNWLLFFEYESVRLHDKKDYFLKKATMTHWLLHFNSHVLIQA